VSIALAGQAAAPAAEADTTPPVMPTGEVTLALAPKRGTVDAAVGWAAPHDAESGVAACAVALRLCDGDGTDIVAAPAKPKKGKHVFAVPTGKLAIGNSYAASVTCTNGGGVSATWTSACAFLDSAPAAAAAAAPAQEGGAAAAEAAQEDGTDGDTRAIIFSVPFAVGGVVEKVHLREGEHPREAAALFCERKSSALLAQLADAAALDQCVPLIEKAIGSVAKRLVVEMEAAGEGL